MTQQEKFINQVKEAVDKQPIPPIYNPDEWKGIYFNCYAYAMRMLVDFWEYNYNHIVGPGIISGCIKEPYQFEKENVLQYFKKDCKALGLKVLSTNLEEQISEDEYKIAVYVWEGRDYHFARQDSNGIWSEKNCWRGPIETIELEDITKNKDGYEFIGIFKVSKNVPYFMVLFLYKMNTHYV